MAIRSLATSSRIDTGRNTVSIGSACFWFNRQGDGGGPAPRFSAVASGVGDQALWYASAPELWQFQQRFSDGSLERYVWGVATQTNVLYRLAYSWNFSTINIAPELWIDGVEVLPSKEINATSATPVPPSELMLFNRSDFQRGMDAIMAHVAFWDVRLSADELQALSQGMSPGAIQPANRILWIPGDRAIYDRQGNSLTVTTLSVVADLDGLRNPGLRSRALTTAGGVLPLSSAFASTETAIAGLALSTALTASEQNSERFTTNATLTTETIQVSSVFADTEIAIAAPTEAIAVSATHPETDAAFGTATVQFDLMANALETWMMVTTIPSGFYERPLLTVLTRLPQAPAIASMTRLPQTPIVEIQT